MAEREVRVKAPLDGSYDAERGCVCCTCVCVYVYGRWVAWRAVAIISGGYAEIL